jgi:hypothetical protein
LLSGDFIGEIADLVQQKEQAAADEAATVLRQEVSDMVRGGRHNIQGWHGNSIALPDNAFHTYFLAPHQCLDRSYLTLVPSQVVVALAHIGEWTYNMFDLDEATGGRPLSALAYHLFDQTGLTTRLKLDRVKLSRFLIRIEDGYRNNPYHNRSA